MSGLEIAGAVLGALPLIISALEHYATGVRTAKRFWRYKSVMEDLITQIDTQHGIFINTLELLLWGLVTVEQMTDLLIEPGGDGWRDAKLDSKLRDRLRSAYDAYFRNVDGLNKSLVMIMGKLALDPDGKPQFSDPNLFKQEYKRLKFSLSKSEYSEHVSGLERHNSALTLLTHQSRDLEPSRAKNKSDSRPNFGALQRYASNLYDTIRLGLQCSCEDHGVKLRLESRKTSSEHDNFLEDTPFRVIFTYKSATTAASLSWKEADIRWIAEISPSIPLRLNVQDAPTTNASTDRRLRFSEPPTQKRNSNTTVTITQSQAVVLTPSSPEQIRNLCQAITKFQQLPVVDTCAGYLLDNLKRRHGVYPVSAPAHNNTQHGWSAYTLQQVLNKHVDVHQGSMLHNKFKLAVDLASSVLQLYRTPWLNDDLSSSDVYFVQRPDTPRSLICQYPFIKRTFPTTNVVQPPLHQAPMHRVIRNPTLFALGILLIELLYETPIENLQTDRDRDCEGTPGAVWCTVGRLVDEEISFKAGQLYSDAVRRCIRCDFNQKTSSLDDQDFQRAVFDGVVIPLEKSLQFFKGELDD